MSASSRVVTQPGRGLASLEEWLSRFQLGRLALYGFTILMLAFLLLPTILIVPISLSSAEHLEFPPRQLSLRWYEAYLTDPGWIDPTLFSLKVAVLVAPLATIIGTMTALALVRGQVRGRSVLDALITAPLIVPSIIFAISVALFFAPLRLSGTTLGFVLAHTAAAAPYVVLIVSAALYRIDPALELAAMSLGASRLTAILRITLPLVRPSVVTGAVFAFLTSFDDATISFFISGVTDKSLPRKMFENLEFAISPVVAAVSTLLSVVTLLVLGGMVLAQRRSMVRARRREVPGVGEPLV